MSGPLKEASIKLGILKLLESLRLLDADAAIASELAVAGHKRRIDLAVFGTRSVGIEIKSEVDTLKRLQDQTETYLPYFDDLLVIVGERHIEKAINIAPPQASVWSVSGEGVFSLVRKPLQAHTADITARLRWLTLKDLRRLAGPEYRIAARLELMDALREAPAPALQERVMEGLRHRFGKSTRAFRMALRDDLQPAEAIARLSRSYERREAEKALAKRSRESWSKWQNASTVGNIHAAKGEPDLQL